jgi:general secretion pathway protein I
MITTRPRGFTLIEVLVALAVVAMGLAALMTAVSSTASASSYLRQKAQAQWIALNRLVEVRLNLQKFGTNADTGELDFANQHWHYDTQYFDTSIQTMRRVVVRVYAGSGDTKGPAIAESTGFLGTAVTVPGSSNQVDWTSGQSMPPAAGAPQTGKAAGTPLQPPAGTTPSSGLGGLGSSSSDSFGLEGAQSGTDGGQGGSTPPPDGSGGTGLN